jgi:hypothetical protein
VGWKGAGDRPDVIGQRAGADLSIRRCNVERVGLDLPQRIPCGLFLLEVLRNGWAREVEAGGADLRVKARQSMCSTAAILPQGIPEILHICGMPVLAFGGNVCRNTLGQVE